MNDRYLTDHLHQIFFEPTLRRLKEVQNECIEKAQDARMWLMDIYTELHTLRRENEALKADNRQLIEQLNQRGNHEHAT